jgi:RimJ/RimL family protein N-acetyltransferase
MAILKSPYGRLVLRPLDPDRDGPALHAIFGDEESCRYMTGPATASVEETIASLKTWQSGSETTWAVAARADGPAQGRIALIPRREGVFEAACMIVPEARGRDLAARSLALVIDHAFASLAMHRVYADIDPDNAPCIKTFQNLGFQFEGRLRAEWKTHIGLRDSVIMGLLEGDRRPWRK